MEEVVDDEQVTGSRHLVVDVAAEEVHEVRALKQELRHPGVVVATLRDVAIAAGAGADGAAATAYPGDGRRPVAGGDTAVGSRRVLDQGQLAGGNTAALLDASAGWLGAARGGNAGDRNAGDAVNAKAAYKRFLTNYRFADAGLPEVAEAREALR